MKFPRALFYGIPLLIVMMVGGLLAMLVDILGWFEDRLRMVSARIQEEMER